MEEVINPLKIAFADTYAFYVKAQNYHWNVEGPMFAMYHDFFGKIYEEVGGAIDQFAEEIRAQNAYAPGAFSRFSELTNIRDEVLIIKPETMVATLFADNAEPATRTAIRYVAADDAWLHTEIVDTTVCVAEVKS